MKKNWLALILAVVFAVGVLGGCSGGSANEEPSGGNDVVVSDPADTAPADLVAAALSGSNSVWGDAAWEAAVREKVEGTTLTIGFTPPAASEFYDIIIHGCYTMMNELHNRFGINFEFDYVAPSEHDAVESQIATIENWVTMGYDVVLVCTAGDAEAMNAVYKKATAAGTAVYLFNMPAELWNQDDIQATSVIGYNNAVQSGYLVGQYAAEKLNGEGEILFISGNDGHWTTSRRNGFEAAIAEYPGLSIVGEARGEYVRDAGMEAAENLLQANPNVDFIYGENEEMAQGAVAAIESMGLKLWDGESGIIVIGADGLDSGYDLIRNGELTGTVDVGSVDHGRQSIYTIFMHECLGYSVDKVINVPTILVDNTNVDVPQAYVQWALSVKPDFN